MIDGRSPADLPSDDDWDDDAYGLLLALWAWTTRPSWERRDLLTQQPPPPRTRVRHMS
jgi:hypothetical protein